MLQRDIFTAGEGDAWFRRNQGQKAMEMDPVVTTVETLQLRPRSILEVGCADGQRLAWLRSRFDARCHGIDPSTLAIETAQSVHPEVTFSIGTAESMPAPDGSVDLLIFGFCLYLTDPVHHFRILAEADRVLADGGKLCVFDFAPGRPYRRAYSHKEGVFAHKLDWTSLFTAHPAYRLLHRRYLEHAADYSFIRDESITVDVLVKSVVDAFPTFRGEAGE